MDKEQIARQKLLDNLEQQNFAENFLKELVKLGARDLITKKGIGLCFDTMKDMVFQEMDKEGKNATKK